MLATLRITGRPPLLLDTISTCGAVPLPASIMWCQPVRRVGVPRLAQGDREQRATDSKNPPKAAGPA